MDGSSGSGRDDWRPPDTQPCTYSRSEVIDFEILELIPGATATFLAEAGQDPISVQGYCLQCDVGSLAGILQAVGGKKEASRHLFTSSQIFYLREQQGEGETGLFLIDGRLNYFLVRFTKDEPINVVFVFKDTDSDSKHSQFRLPGPPYRFEKGSRIILHKALDVCCSSSAR